MSSSTSATRVPTTAEQWIRDCLISVPQNELNEGVFECAICMDAFGIRNKMDNDRGSDTAVRSAQCNHIFGNHCVQSWVISNNRNSNRCPVCRALWFLARTNYSSDEEDSDYDEGNSIHDEEGALALEMEEAAVVPRWMYGDRSREIGGVSDEDNADADHAFENEPPGQDVEDRGGEENPAALLSALQQGEQESLLRIEEGIFEGDQGKLIEGVKLLTSHVTRHYVSLRAHDQAEVDVIVANAIEMQCIAEAIEAVAEEIMDSPLAAAALGHEQRSFDLARAASSQVTDFLRAGIASSDWETEEMTSFLAR